MDYRICGFDDGHAALAPCAPAGRQSAEELLPRSPSFLKIAIVTSLLSFVVAGILAHGLYFTVIHSVQQLTVEAAHATVKGVTPAEREQMAEKTVDAAIAAYPLLRRDRVSVQVTGAVDNPALYNVTLTYDASHIGIWSLADFVPLPSSQIQRSSTIRRGGP